MLCRALLAAVALTCTFGETIAHAKSQGTQRALKDLICVLVLSGMQKEDLDVNLLRKLQRHNINADDIYTDKVYQECQLNTSDELSIMKTRRNNNNSSVNQNITSNAHSNIDNSSQADININNRTTEATMTKDLLKDRVNDTDDKRPYEVEATSDHNIKTRSSANDVNSTQVAKFSESMMLFADQKNVDSIMNMLQSFFKAKLEENNNKEILKTSTSVQITTTPPTKPTEVTTESKSKDSDIIKVLATFVFNKPIPVESQYKLDDDVKNSLISRLLDKIEAKSAKTDPPEDSTNDENKTTELFSDHDYMSYNTNFAETTSSSVDDEYKHSVQSNFLVDQMMNRFRTKSKINPTTYEYEKNGNAFSSSQNENFYIPNLKNIVKMQANSNYDEQRQFDDSEYSKLDDIINLNKGDINKNEVAKSLHTDIIKDIADKVKEIVLRDLKKEILPSTKIVSPPVTTTQKSTTTNPQIPQKNKNHIQQASHAIQKFVDLLEQLKSAKESIGSPVKYDSSKKGNKTSKFNVDAKEKDINYQIKSENKAPTVNQNDCITMLGNMPNVAPVNNYKMPNYNVPKPYHQQYPIVSYFDNTPNNMVPPLISNPYGVQPPGGPAVINVRQEIPHNNKHNTINIITPVNHTPVININQMRPAPITIQTSKEIPPIGIPMSIPDSMNTNIVLPTRPSFLNTLDETEKQRWAYILKYGRNPDTRGELADLKNKLAQYTNLKNTPIKQGSGKKFESSILDFSTTNKRGPLPDSTKFSLPTIIVREPDKMSGPTVFGSPLFNTRDKINEPKMINSATEIKPKQEKLLDFKSYKLPDLTIREAHRTGYKNFNSLDKQERERIIDPTLTTGKQAKDTTMKKLNTNYKQQQVYDDAVLSDIKTKLLYHGRYKSDDEYRGLTNREPLTSLIPNVPKNDYYDRLNVYKPRFLEASANYPNIDPNFKCEYNNFSKREPYSEHIDVSKPRDLYVPRKDPMPKYINDIKGFHEKLERGDYYERLDPANLNEWYENPKTPLQYDVNNKKQDDTYYTKTPPQYGVNNNKQADTYYTKLPRQYGVNNNKQDDTYYTKLPRQYGVNNNKQDDTYYTKIPRQYDVNNNKQDDNYYTKTNIESRQQLPLTGGTRMSKFDDTHFKNFLKTQQKVNDMLERILATKTNQDYAHSVETT